MKILVQGSKQRFNNLTLGTLFLKKFQPGPFKDYLLKLPLGIKHQWFSWDCKDLLCTFPILLEPVMEST